MQDAMQYIHDEHPDTSDEMNLSTHLMDSAALTTSSRSWTTRWRRTRVTCSPRSTLRSSGSTPARTGLARTAAQEIPTERLEALPYASLCIDCKRREGEQ